MGYSSPKKQKFSFSGFGMDTAKAVGLQVRFRVRGHPSLSPGSHGPTLCTITCALEPGVLVPTTAQMPVPPHGIVRDCSRGGHRVRQALMKWAEVPRTRVVLFA